MDVSVHQDQGVNGGKADLDGYYRDRAAVRREVRGLMDGKGVYVPLKWAKRWDPETAMYLGHYVSYAGTQRDRHGWISDSEREVEDKTGITPRRQRPRKKRLVEEGVIEVRTGGIGNKTQVRVNIPLLKLMDEAPSFEGIAAEVERAPVERTPDRTDELAERRERRRAATQANAEPEDHSAPDVQSGLHETYKAVHTPGTKRFARGVQTHNSNSAVTPSNSPEPERAVERTDGRAAKCLDVLGEMEMSKRERERLPNVLEGLVGRYRKLDAVAVCREVVNYASTRQVGSPAKLLETFFENAEQKRQAEPTNPHGADAPVFKASEQEADSGPRLDPRKLARLLAQGVPDDEAVRRATVGDEERRTA